MKKFHLYIVCFLSLLSLLPSQCFFYLPGTHPQEFLQSEKIEVKVGNLVSSKNPIAKKYYMAPFCPSTRIPSINEGNLGIALSGGAQYGSDYEVMTNLRESCKILCKIEYNKDQLEQLVELVEDGYQHVWYVDSLPSATRFFEGEEGPFFDKGFPLGFVVEEGDGITPGVYVNNHLKLILSLHTAENDEERMAPQDYHWRVVGFEVKPFSIKHQYSGPWLGRNTHLSTCSSDSNNVPQHQELKYKPGANKTTIIWTYDVEFEKSPVAWASRWDMYLQVPNDPLHWASLANSIGIVFVLAGMVALILMNALHKDFRRYNEVDHSEEAQQEETGWKLVYADVFRPVQTWPVAFCVLLGTGTQIFLTVVPTMFFAVLGFLSPANRGGLINVVIVLFCLMTFFSSYVSIKIYYMLGLPEAKWHTALWSTIFFFPGMTFLILFILNMLIMNDPESGRVPFLSLLQLFALYLVIACPLGYLGGSTAAAQVPIKNPIAFNLIPREVPEQPFYLKNSFVVFLMGGILPFGAVLIEVTYVMSAVWQNKFYYLFPFLFLVLLILIVTSAEITIVVTYFQLCSEQYNWWWRSFITPSSSAFYFFIYSTVFFFTRLDIIPRFISIVFFFGYVSLASLAFCTLTGGIGFVASYIFIRKIYSAIKID